MTKLMTPMDFAMAGLGVWRKQAQTVAMVGMRLPYSNPWLQHSADVMERASQAQAQYAVASRKVSLAMLDAVHRDQS